MPEYKQENRIIRIYTPLGEDELLLQGFDGQEGISRLFHFSLRLMSENRSIKFEDIVGKRATIAIVLPDGSERFINGLISSFSQGGSSTLEEGDKPTVFTHYSASLVPWFWMLTRTSDCRIFQEMTVPEILEKIFKDNGFADFKNKLQGNFAKREYCVQYRETDFNFVSRLMEEEGIFYFFEHEKEKHTLILANNANEFKPCPLQDMVSYKTVIGQERDEDVITDFTMSREVRPGQYTVRDFNFENPGLDLTSNLSGKGESKLEIYDYPGEYKTKDEGERLVGIRIQEEDLPQVVVNGASTCRGLVTGYRFDLRDHYRRDFNKAYVLTSIQHSADLGESWRSSDAGETTLSYYNSFQCIQHPTPFRSPRITPVPVVAGSQTAIVVGPPGEEIYTDKYGRVKVQFHWDREGKYDAMSSCWIRVSTTWAGKGWGQISLPRIGQEVIVDFLEGDPDRPIIVGRVYNADSMPPYKLPDEMTKSTVKTYSSKGGGGFNEIRMEDKKGDEQLFMHAEKDMDLRVKNDRREWIGRDTHLIVKRDQKELIERDQQIVIKRDQVEEIGRDHHLKIKGKEAIEITGAQSVAVKGNVTEEISGNHTESTTGNIYVKGMQVVIESSSGLTLKCGGNFITLLPAGVFIQGTMVMINSGGAALPGMAGMLVSPTAPAEADIADNADPGDKAPTYKQQWQAKSASEQAAANAPSHNPNSEENKEKKSKIEIEVVNEDGKPVPGLRYRVTLPDGQTLAEGTLDEKGYALVAGIDPGSCKVTFPDLDKEAWTKA
ncbi:MAG: type VI secretion system tip protein VgrG [Acidobacteria bacterium]|nr:type VI secretion system tip protein VgrG [Acidobacteriota bacterium]